MHLVRWCILAVAESSALTSRGMALTGMRRQDRVSATSRSVHGSGPSPGVDVTWMAAGFMEAAWRQHTTAARFSRDPFVQ